MIWQLRQKSGCMEYSANPAIPPMHVRNNASTKPHFVSPSLMNLPCRRLMPSTRIHNGLLASFTAPLRSGLLVLMVYSNLAVLSRALSDDSQSRQNDQRHNGGAHRHGADAHGDREMPVSL